MENPPLWVWAIVVGIIIAGKFIYRWQATKQIASIDKKPKGVCNTKRRNMLETITEEV